jgi:hypothetical protein
VLALALVGFLGSALGAMLLVALPSTVFVTVVPILIASRHYFSPLVSGSRRC